MTLRSTTARWGTLIRMFHWGMFVLYAAMLFVGYYMTDLPLGMFKMKIYAFHKSLGVLLLGLAVMRLLWRVVDRGPAPIEAPAWQRAAAVAVMLLLYGLMLALPLSGWLYNSAAGFPLRWFNLINLPALLGADPTLKVLLKAAHSAAAIIFMTVIGLHGAAALKHHWMDRDQTLRRMLPW
jgi:cytochrome b561